MASSPDQVTQSIRTLLYLMDRRRSESARRHGLAPTALMILASLQYKSPQTPSSLAAELGRTHGAIAQVTGKLTAEKPIVRIPHPTDSRSALYVLSDQGAALIRAEYEPLRAALADVVSDLGTSTLQQVQDFLDRYTSALDGEGHR